MTSPPPKPPSASWRRAGHPVGLELQRQAVTTWFLRTSTGLGCRWPEQRMSVAAWDDGRGAPSGDVGESFSSTAAPPGESKPSIFAGDGTTPSWSR